MLVKESEKFLGIFTHSNLEPGVDPETTTVGAMMSSPIITIDGDCDVDEARKLMQEHLVRHLAVTQNGEIVGVFSSNDLVH
ncbi:hypothetical protein UZ36_04000 [Candidatus Nitromaritima sp. SCGC AAA799-C22]|nr:hypothetical protein UZ36_04000 [Candidatus Nitromaritima sp. SCGC AAA799-C22]